jgi:hypothetical protein
MKPSVISFSIWAITIFLNAVFFGVAELGMGNIGTAIGALAILAMGYVFGLPFWPLLWLLITLIMALPFSAAGRITWLIGILGILVALFYASIAWIITGHFTLHHPLGGLLAGTTIAAMVMAFFFHRKAFGKELAGITNSKPE